MSSVLFSIEIPLKIIVTRKVKLPHSVQTTAEFEYLQQYCSPQSHTRTSCGDSFILCEWKNSGRCLWLPQLPFIIPLAGQRLTKLSTNNNIPIFPLKIWSILCSWSRHISIQFIHRSLVEVLPKRIFCDQVCRVNQGDSEEEPWVCAFPRWHS